jgi:tol-pal system protein YbgF
MKPSKIIALCLFLAGSTSTGWAENYRPVPIETRTDSQIQYQPAPDPAGVTVHQPAVQGNLQWELYSQLQQMQEELRRLRGQLEEQAHQIDQMQRQQRERYLDLDQRISRLSAAGAMTGTSSGADPSAATSVDAQAQILDEKATYDQAINLLRQKKFDESIRLLEQLLTSAPNGIYAGHAMYWLGELYMALTPKRMDVAKEQFIRLLSQFKDHTKVPDSLYKLASIYEQEGDKERAKVTVEKLLKEHPEHQAARLGRELLGRL